MCLYLFIFVNNYLITDIFCISNSFVIRYCGEYTAVFICELWHRKYICDLPICEYSIFTSTDGVDRFVYIVNN